eukprot:6186865-Pleurochrysis_carterae.AAC.3
MQSGEPPPIMGVIPVVDPSLLSVARVPEGEAVAPESHVRLGETLFLTHNGTKGPLGFQTVFIVSSGTIDGGQACGSTGAQLSCTSCGAGWLRHARWTPTEAGEATVAVGAARAGFGTPAVTIASLRVLVEQNFGGGTAL